MQCFITPTFNTIKTMKSLFLFVLCLSVLSFGEELWTRTHYIGLSFNKYWATGDINGKKTISLDDEGIQEDFHLPTLHNSFIPEVEVGVNIKAHTIAIAFGYNEQSELSYMRVGADYRYYLFWPEPLQLGLGVNYAFMKIYAEDNVLTQKEEETPIYSNGKLMGNGFSAVSSLRYYFTEHLGTEVSLKYSYFFFNSLNTNVCGTCPIDNSPKEHFGELGIKLFFQL